MLLIIDYSPILNKIYYNQKYVDNINQKYELFSRSLNMISGIVSAFSDVTLVIAIDGQKQFYSKKKIYDEYKSTRSDRKVIIEACNEYMVQYAKNKNFTVIRNIAEEADDIVASIIEQEKNNYEYIEVYTTDKDYFQLISKNVCINRGNKRYNQYVFEQEFNFPVDCFVDYLSIIGDKVDNVPGVTGIGHVTATKLIQEYKNIKEIKLAAEKQDEIYMKKTVYNKINDQCLVLDMSYDLVKMKRDIPLPEIPNVSITSYDIKLHKQNFDRTYSHHLSYYNIETEV